MFYFWQGFKDGLKKQAAILQPKGIYNRVAANATRRANGIKVPKVKDALGKVIGSGL